MPVTTSNIFLNGLRIYAYHGVLEQESRVGQWFSVDISVGYDFSRAMLTDDVADTLSYADLLEIVRHEMAVPSQLLEHVASRIVQNVLKAFPQVNAIDLRLTKLNPPMGASLDGAGVSLHWQTKET